MVPADAVTADLASVLDTDERFRAAALSDPDDRRRFVAWHGAVRVIVGRALGVPPEDVHWRYAGNGKPEITGIHINLSHSGELGVVAVCGTRAVGVDVQRAVPDAEAVALANRYFPAREARSVASGVVPGERFARLWCRKEACVKAVGGRLAEGLGLPVRGAVVPMPDGTVLRLRDVAVPDGYRAAVAVDGAAPYRITRYGWSVSMADTHRYRSAGS